MKEKKLVRATDLVIPHINEAIKSHFEYDGFGRLLFSVTALADSDHGDRALRTDYQYLLTTNKVTGSKEELTTWDSAWDF